MSIFEAVVLGIIQGLTEFLPVSSSGHLEIAKVILGDGSVGRESMLMTVVLHFATALSTVVIFRKELLQIFKGLFQFKWNDQAKFSLKIILSMIPAALVGILLKDEIESLFGGALLLVGFMLLLTGILLFLADKAKQTDKEVGFMQSVIIGISQAIAILPGISRSGATISTSVLLGIDREKSARFSFLMVVPLIFGAIVVDGKDYKDTQDLEALDAKDRSMQIQAELIEDEILTQPESILAWDAIFSKEHTWSQSKEQGKSNDRELQDTYYADLEKASFSHEKIMEITTHEYGQVRPIQGPNVIALSIGFICAFVTGLFACQWMIALVKRAKLKYFSFYCFGVGLIAIVYSII